MANIIITRFFFSMEIVQNLAAPVLVREISLRALWTHVGEEVEHLSSGQGVGRGASGSRAGALRSRRFARGGRAHLLLLLVLPALAPIHPPREQ